MSININDTIRYKTGPAGIAEGRVANVDSTSVRVLKGEDFWDISPSNVIEKFVPEKVNFEFLGGEEVLSSVSFYKKYLDNGRIDVIAKAFERMFQEVVQKGLKPETQFRVRSSYEDGHYVPVDLKEKYTKISKSDQN